MARSPLRDTPPPLDVDAVSIVTGGTILWAVAGIALAIFGRDWLGETGHTDWIWTCAVGAGLGLAGIWYCVRRRNRIRRGDPDR